MKQDIYWVHIIRAAAVMFVLLLHSSAQVLQLGAPYASTDWWLANVLDSSVRMCVPLLFMLTGFLLLGKTEPLGAFFSKRFQRIALPLLVWTAIYACWLVFVESQNPTPISPFAKEITEGLLAYFPFSLLGLVFAPAYYHLWFMYALIGLYLCLPLLRPLVQNAERKLLWYFVGLWALATFVFPGIEAAGMYNLIEVNMVTGNVGYLVLGYLLGSVSISRRSYLWMWPVYLLCVAITAVGTWMVSSAENLNQTFYGNVPSVLLMTVSSFLILRYLGEHAQVLQQPRVKAVLLSLSACTFGIYLIHALFLYIFHKGMLGFTLDAVQGNALLFIPLTALVTYLVSWGCVSLIRRVPYLRAIVGEAAKP